MPVFVTYKKLAYSNESKTLPESNAAGTVVGTSKTVIQSAFPSPFIDRLSVVLNVPNDSNAYEIHSGIWTQFEDTEVFKSGKKWGNFQVGKRIVLPSILIHKKWPLLHYRYESNKAVQLRLEFSPVDLGPKGLDELHAQLISLVHEGWGYFAEHGRITMIEVAVDLPNISVDQFHVLPQQGPSVMMWKANGQLETLVLGKSSGSQTRIYDRGKKRVALGQKWNGPVTTRVERRIRFQKATPLADLAQLPNPFATFTLVAAPLTAPPSEEKSAYVWPLFLDSVSIRGLPAALKLLPKGKRTIYRGWLAQHPMPWWNPDAIWAQWPGLLGELKLSSIEHWH